MKLEELTGGSKSNSAYMAHLRLCDGSKDVMVGHLPMHFAHEGNKLAEGDTAGNVYSGEI